MAQKVVSMEAKLAAVFSSPFRGVRVSELCEQLEISRQTFYKYRRRFQVEGPAGLVERSRRPHRSPAMIAAELEDEIVRLRKTLPLDNGAQTIAYYLERRGWPVPSVATIRREKGHDIDAACGQLRLQTKRDNSFAETLNAS